MPRSERIARLLVVPMAILFAFALFRVTGSVAPDPVTISEGDGASGASDGDGSSSATTGGTSATTILETRAQVAYPANRGMPPVEPVGTYQDGVLLISGSAPNQAIASGYEFKLAALLGGDNVNMQMTRDPRVSGKVLRIDLTRSFRPPDGGTGIDPGYESLAALSTTLLDGLPESTLVVTGHTDSVGTDATNLALSIARARLVVDLLVERGIPVERITATGAGESQPIASNDTPEGREANRRITASFEGITPE